MLKKGAEDKHKTTKGLVNEENMFESDLEDGSTTGLAET